MLFLLPLEGAALLLVRTPGRDISVSWEEQDPEPEAELCCRTRTHRQMINLHFHAQLHPQASLFIVRQGTVVLISTDISAKCTVKQLIAST